MRCQLYNLHICFFLDSGDLVSPYINGIVIVYRPSQETGWVPQHIVARDDYDKVLGVVPLYLKRFDLFSIDAKEKNITVYSYFSIIYSDKHNVISLHNAHICNWIIH